MSRIIYFSKYTRIHNDWLINNNHSFVYLFIVNKNTYSCLIKG